MDPIKIELSVVPDAEIEILTKKCAALENQNRALKQQLDALRSLYHEVLLTLGDLRKSP